MIAEERGSAPEPEVDTADYARAVLNILDDLSEERDRMADLKRAKLNILEDLVAEKAALERTQSALLNILEDVAALKEVEQLNRRMAREIAERKQAERELRLAKAEVEAASRELEAFSYSVAHDLRAPLRSIDGFSQALIEDCGDQVSEEGRAYIRFVRESAQQMAVLIDDLLELARVSRAELSRGRCDLAETARSIVERLRRDDPSRDVEVVIPERVPAVGDERLLRVVLENLLGNAWKFTSKRPRARIELARRVEGGRPVYSVRDDGAGFDMAYSSKLFGVFQRLHAVTEFEGTGIGLATVQRIVQRHGGRVWAEGAVDRGATFHFTLEENA